MQYRNLFLGTIDLTEDHIASGFFGNGTSSAVIEEAEQGRQGELANIISGCRANKSSSQEKLYKKFYGYALAVALAYCYNREEAVEVVNDSFIKVFRNIETFITTEPFRPWLRKIVVNTSIDKVRATRKFQHQVDIKEMKHASQTDIESELTAKQIYAMLNELPEALRLVFNMYEIEGYSHREIAGRLDIAESSSRTYLARAKEQLRDLYKTLFAYE